MSVNGLARALAVHAGGEPADRDGAGLPPVDRAVRAFLTVVYGCASALGPLLSEAADPHVFAAAVAAAELPWRHATSASEHRFSWERTINPVPVPEGGYTSPGSTWRRSSTSSTGTSAGRPRAI
ncbi:hypothetical protein SCALM49S_04347 [Streptomyces californicus]